jgi:citrate lyase subunit beta/citryl-CoA lyase
MTAPSTPTVLPRSFLYVPATKPDLFPKATVGPADAVVLDLEDAVPLRNKPEARGAIRRWLEGEREQGAEQWVRVNAEAVAEDLDTAVRPGLAGLFLAKASLASVSELAETLDRLESERGLLAGSVRVVGLLESARALVDVPALARTRRLTTFGIGEVDLLADLRVSRSDRSAAAVDALRTQVVVHAAASGLAAPVAPTSTDFRDLASFAESTRLMHDLGFRSRTAIHPAQVPVIHQVLTPTPKAVAAARGVVDRFDAAGGGVTTDEHGRLIDAAVVRAAQETLARADRPREG